MYLFDTDILTNVLKKTPSSSLLLRLNETDPCGHFTSTITISEIVYGAFKSHRPEYHLKQLERILLPEIGVLDFDISAGYVAGNIRAELERIGTPLAWPDIQIAAIAITHELMLVTGNVKHFSRITGLRLENWLEP